MTDGLGDGRRDVMVLVGAACLALGAALVGAALWTAGEWEATAGEAGLVVVLFLASAMAGLLAWGAVLYRQAARDRRRLTERLARREAELNAHRRELNAQARRIVFDDERRELLRDMHEGIGGRLVSLLTQIRFAPPDRQAMTEGLQASLDDLRLIVDAMDGAGDSLEVAVAIYHERMAPRLMLAGVALDWRAEPGLDSEGFGPRVLINIYRILQEAVDNALRHARPKRIDICLSAAPLGRLRLEVANDGQAPSGVPAFGRGLQMMRRRAARIGAVLSVAPRCANGASGEAEEAGLVVRLDLPRAERALVGADLWAADQADAPIDAPIDAWRGG